MSNFLPLFIFNTSDLIERNFWPDGNLQATWRKFTSDLTKIETEKTALNNCQQPQASVSLATRTIDQLLRTSLARNAVRTCDGEWASKAIRNWRALRACLAGKPFLLNLVPNEDSGFCGDKKWVRRSKEGEAPPHANIHLHILLARIAFLSIEKSLHLRQTFL